MASSAALARHLWQRTEASGPHAQIHWHWFVATPPKKVYYFPHHLVREVARGFERCCWLSKYRGCLCFEVASEEDREYKAYIL